ncbi:MAG: phage portal protein [Spirochaetota bacterium]|nr:phage portal protein [Spirochaetota bacterium]
MKERITLKDRFSAFFNPKAGPLEILREMLISTNSSAGIPVNETTAMRVSAFFAAVRVLTESIASLPLELYRRLPDGGKSREVKDRRYRLLHTQPNSWQTSFEFREMLTYHVIMRGNGYAFISRGRDGQVRELIPMHPDKTLVEQDRLYRLKYTYSPKDASPIHLDQGDVLHIRGLSIDGFTGVSLLTWAREVIGGALGQQEHGNRLWKNGANPGIALKHPGKLNDEAYRRLKESWDANYSGASNSAKTVIIEEGMSIERIAMTSEDAQFIESRKFSRSEIAGITRVPPHMIGDLERATFSNIEHQDLAFVKHSLRPWLVRWEQVILRDLIRQPDLFVEFNIDGLARGDLKSRYEAYAIGRNWGWLSVNDIREKENMNPVEEGDEYLRPLNMQPVGKEVPEILKTRAGVSNLSKGVNDEE